MRLLAAQLVERPAAIDAGSACSGAAACRSKPAVNQNVEPDAFAALDADFAAHQLGEAPDDRQPEPGAAVAARRRRVDLRERLEQRVQRDRQECRCRCRAPRSAAGRAAASLTALRVTSDRHAAALRELDGVAAQIDQDLPEAARRRRARAPAPSDRSRLSSPVLSPAPTTRIVRTTLLDAARAARTRSIPGRACRPRSWRSRGCR